jgi:hypothetical protein
VGAGRTLSRRLAVERSVFHGLLFWEDSPDLDFLVRRQKGVSNEWREDKAHLGL